LGKVNWPIEHAKRRRLAPSSCAKIALPITVADETRRLVRDTRMVDTGLVLTMPRPYQEESLVYHETQ
jgi:hypothetical protein